MFALTVDRNQWEVKVAADETLASEVIGHVESFQPDAIVVGTLPPGGVAHARYLVTRLHRQFPELKVLVGRWGASESLDPERDDSITHADSVDHSFADTRKRLASLYPVLAARESREGGANRDRALVGTTGA